MTMFRYRAANGLAVQADFELGKRGVPGGLGQVALIVVFLMATPFYESHRGHALALGSIIFALNLLRAHLGLQQSRYYPGHRVLWNRLFALTIIAPALSWGSLFFVVIRDYGVASYTTIVACLIGSGISAAITTSVSPRRRLARLFVTFVIGIPLIELFLEKDRQSLAMGLIFMIYYGFLWFQLKLQHRNYWDDLHSHKYLMEEKNRLQAVLDAIPGLVSWVGSDLVVHGVNVNYAMNYGGAPGEFIGKRLAYKNEDHEFVEAVQRFILAPSIHETCELRLSASGTLRWHLLVMRKTSQDVSESSTYEVYLICIDIHDLKLAQAELEEQRVSSEQTSKLATLGEFTASIAHEIKTPLTAIAATVDLIHRNLATAAVSREKLEEQVKRASLSCERVQKIVSGLSRFSRSTNQEPFTKVRLSQIVKDSLELTSVHFRTNRVSLESDPIDPELMLWCRPVEISQVLVNLLSNAIDAAKVTEERWVRLRVGGDGGQLTLAITDSGTGIPRNLHEKLFQPFFTTKAPGSGTGLGLSISRRIIERHGGSLELDPAARNTTFVVKLRAVEKLAKPA